MRAALAALCLLLMPATAARAGGVVSLNLCADDFLMTLAPDRVAALSPLARDKAISAVADPAREKPWVRADAEAVLALHPDLVLAADYGAQATLAALRASGVRVERVGLPQNFAAIRDETRRLAAMLSAQQRGEAVLAAMDATLAAIPPRPPLRALLLEPRGWTVGKHSLGQAVLQAAGLVDIGDGRQWPLEAIAAHPPDEQVLPAAPDTPSLASDLLRHPALRGVPFRTVDPALLICGGPWTALAAKRLAQ
jgi:iron complex transport system substrate-binding protein